MKANSLSETFSLKSIQEARKRLAEHLVPTLLIHSPYLSELTGKRVWLKLETQNPTGSFKVRPAFNGALTHYEQAQKAGIIASSSGNFAQAVAYVARKLSLKAMIVMMSSTSPYKIEKTRALGAEVVICGDSFKDRWDTTFRLQKETGRLLLHPYDSKETIEGDGTLALELLEQLSGDFTVIVPTSGGGLLSGIAATLRAARPGCKTFGVQPKVNASMVRSLEAGKPIQVPPFKTVADALIASIPGEHCFELTQTFVEKMLLVEEAEIEEAAALAFRNLKLVIEPGAATSIAALVTGKVVLGSLLEDVVLVLTGGNIAEDKLISILQAHPDKA